jgi:hypothetical protein
MAAWMALRAIPCRRPCECLPNAEARGLSVKHLLTEGKHDEWANL